MDNIEISCRACMVTGSNKRFHSLLQEPLRSVFTDSTSIQVSALEIIQAV